MSTNQKKWEKLNTMLFFHMDRDVKILQNLSLLSTQFSNSQLHLFQKVLFTLKKGWIFLVAMSSWKYTWTANIHEKLVWKEKFQPKEHSEVEVLGGRRNFPDFQKCIIRRVNLVLTAIWLNCCQWIPSKIQPSDSNFCMAHSEYKQAREVVPLNSYLLPWSWTNFGCPMRCRST